MLKLWNMWKLHLNQSKADAYAENFWKKTTCSFDKKMVSRKKYLPDELKNTRAYEFLTEQRFKMYLVAEPSQLVQLHIELFTYILNKPGYTFVQEEWYMYRKDNTQYSFYKAITDVELSCIQKIFNYEAYIAKNPTFAYYLAQLQNVNTCTYCNRQYTLTVMTENNEKIIRPEFDHWFAQSLYPDLALSYYNLIPSCALCNSILKNGQDTELSTHVHPYLNSDAGFKFSYRRLRHGEYSVICKVNDLPEAEKKKVENTLSLFRTQEVYNAHADMELKDLLDLALSHPGDYIDELIYHVMRKTSLTEQDVLRMLFGIECDPENMLNRPLSKFKMDIIEIIRAGMKSK